MALDLQATVGDALASVVRKIEGADRLRFEACMREPFENGETLSEDVVQQVLQLADQVWAEDDADAVSAVDSDGTRR